MKLCPEYDPEIKEWFVEHEGREFTSHSLAGLKANCPTDIQFKGYHPRGYVAVRPGFLESSGRVPFVRYKKGRMWPANLVAPTKPKPEPAPVVAVPFIQPIVRAQLQPRPRPKLPLTDRERIFSLRRKGFNARETANVMRYPIEDIREMLKIPKGRPWDEEQDAQLRQLVEVDGLSADAAGKKLGRTKNAIIGRCHRKGIQLTHLSVADPRFWLLEKNRPGG